MKNIIKKILQEETELQTELFKFEKNPIEEYILKVLKYFTIELHSKKENTYQTKPFRGMEFIIKNNEDTTYMVDVFFFGVPYKSDVLVDDLKDFMKHCILDVPNIKNTDYWNTGVNLDSSDGL
jgi:hypothetical protein